MVLSQTGQYEAELIALEENFWMNHVQAKAPPPYIENDGALILESLRRCMGRGTMGLPSYSHLSRAL